MRLIFAENIPQFCCHLRKVLFPILLLFAVWPSGCNNSCFIFISNPSSGTIVFGAGDTNRACKLTTASATVRLVILAVPRCTFCPESSRIKHIFVGIRGIDVHESLMPDDGSPDWQELVPQLANQPRQIDLLSPIVDQTTEEPLEEIMTIPAGVYRQVRVRFADDVLARDRLQGETACAGAGSNCVVMADNTVRPLLFDTASPELRITTETIAAASLVILPDSGTDLVIELKPVWTFSGRGDMRLFPVFIGSAKVHRVEDQGAPQAAELALTD